MNRVNRASYITLLTLFCCSLLLAGCNESTSNGMLSDTSAASDKSADSDSTDKTVSAPGAFNLTEITPLTTKPKTLKFSWDASSDAKTYTFCQAKDTSAAPNKANCTVLKDALTVTTTTVTVTDILNPNLTEKTFFVIAKNALGNKSSNEKSPTLKNYLGLITYLKPINVSKSASLGNAVALSSDGKTLAVGAYYEDSSKATPTYDGNADDSGAVYIFTFSAGKWTQQQYLKASNIGKDDLFGSSLALSDDGNTLAVGASGEGSSSASTPDDNSASNSGAVYVYTRSSDGKWGNEQYLKASHPDQGDLFGFSLALSDDGKTLAVGDYHEGSGTTDDSIVDNTELESGAVYVFTRSGDTWTKKQYLKAETITKGDNFGRAVAFSSKGQILAVGAPFTAFEIASTTYSQAGAVYVFTRNGDTWENQEQLKAAKITSTASFGAPLALSDDGKTLAIGAVYDDSDSAFARNSYASGSGAVHVFSSKTGSWKQEQYIKASNIKKGDNFGTSLALSDDGNTLAVGSPKEDSSREASENAVNSGAVYVFTRSGTKWTKQRYLKASNVGISDYFGASVALSKDTNTLAAGAYGDDSKSSTDQDVDSDSTSNAGAVYIY